MKKIYKLNFTPFALWNTIVVLVIAIVFYIGVMWVVSNVSLNGGLVVETYFNHQKPMIIISESMEPTIMTNSLLIVRDEPYSNIKKDDIVLIDTEEHGMVIHRVIYDTGCGFITKGDNNLYPDNWVVTKDMYKGKVVKVYNEVANLITFLFGDFTNINTARMLLGFVILALAITTIVIVINWLYDFIFVVFFLRRSGKKGEGKIREEYFNWIGGRVTDEDINEVTLQLDIKRNILQELIFRYRIMRWYNAFKEEEKQVKKVAKRYSKLKGVFKS